METMTITEIMKVLPHRYPFIYIDRILAVYEGPQAGSRLGRKAVALKNVTMNEHFFVGHFPDRPIMPGVILLEAMAQAGCMAFHRKDDPDMDVVIASVRNARFRKPVVPGDSLKLTAEIIRDRGQMLLLQCTAQVDEQLVAEAEVLATITFRTK